MEVATRPGSETEPEAEASESSEVSEVATGWRNEWAKHVERCGNVTWSYIYIYMLLIYDLYDLYDLYDDMNVEEIAKQN